MDLFIPQSKTIIGNYGLDIKFANNFFQSVMFKAYSEKNLRKLPKEFFYHHVSPRKFDVVIFKVDKNIVWECIF